MAKKSSVCITLLAAALLGEWGDELMRAWQEEEQKNEAKGRKE